jgi:hypothetical protein
VKNLRAPARKVRKGRKANYAIPCSGYRARTLAFTAIFTVVAIDAASF